MDAKTQAALAAASDEMVAAILVQAVAVLAAGTWTPAKAESQVCDWYDSILARLRPAVR